MSGFELLRQLRASGSTLPVILMTAHYDETMRLRALQAGCVPLLCKPFSGAMLIEAIGAAAPPSGV